MQASKGFNKPSTESEVVCCLDLDSVCQPLAPTNYTFCEIVLQKFKHMTPYMLPSLENFCLLIEHLLKGLSM